MDDEKQDRVLTTTSTFAESTYGSGSEELPSPSDWSSRYRRLSDYSNGSSLPRDVFRAPPTQYAVFRNFDERSSDHTAGSYGRPLVSDDTTSLILETQRAIRVTRLANEEAAVRDRETHARFMEASKENAWKISESAARVMDRNSNLEMEIARLRADFLKRNEDRQNDLIQRDRELLKKTAELEALRAQVRGLDVELDCLRSQPLESSGEDFAMLAEQLARKDAQVALLDAQTTQLRSQLLAANDLKETLSHAGTNAVNLLLQRLEKSREESSSTVIQLQVANAELLDGKRTAENISECNQREVQSLRASTKQLQRALQDSNKRFDQLVSDWQRERTELSVEVGDANVKVDLWEGQNEILKSENRGLRNQLAEHQEFSQLFRTLNDENVRLRSRVADCVQVRESLDVGVQKALEAAQSQVADLREQLAMAKNDRTDHMLGGTDVHALTAIQEAYETKFQTLQTTLTLDSEASLKNLQLQLDQYKELYEAAVGASSSSVQQGRDAETEARIRVELQHEVESFKTLQRERLEKFYRDTGAKLSTVVANLTKTGQRQTQQLDAQTKNALTDMRSKHLAEVKRVKSAFDASVAEITKQSESRLADQLDDFNRVANEARAAQKQMVEQTSHLRSAVEEKQSLIARLESEVTSMKPLKEELSELKKQLHAKTCEVSHLKSRADHESERARESGKVQAYQQYMVDLRQQLSRLSLTPAATTNADAAIAAREREVAQLRSEVELLNTQIAFLKTNSVELPTHDLMTEADQQRIFSEIQAAAADLDERAKCFDSNMQVQQRQLSDAQTRWSEEMQKQKADFAALQKKLLPRVDAVIQKLESHVGPLLAERNDHHQSRVDLARAQSLVEVHMQSRDAAMGEKRALEALVGEHLGQAANAFQMVQPAVLKISQMEMNAEHCKLESLELRDRLDSALRDWALCRESLEAALNRCEGLDRSRQQTVIRVKQCNCDETKQSHEARMRAETAVMQEQYQQGLKTIEVERAARKADFAAAHDALESLKSQLRLLRSKKEEMDSSRRELENQINGHIQEVIESKGQRKRMQDLESETQQLRLRLKSNPHKAAYKQLAERNERELLALRDDAKSRFDSLLSKLQDDNESNQQMSRNLNDMVQANKDWKDQTREARERVALLEEEICALHSRLAQQPADSEYEEILVKLNALRNDRMRAEAELTRKFAERLQTEVAQAEEAVRLTKQREIDLLAEQTSTQKSSMDALQADLARLKRELMEASEHSATLNVTVRDLRSEKDRTIADLVSEMTRKDANRAKVDGLKKDLEKQLVNANSAVQGLRSQLDNSTAERDTLRTEMTRLRETMDVIETRHQDSLQLTEEFKEVLNQNQVRTAQLEALLRDVDGAIGRQHKSLQDATGDNDRLRDLLVRVDGALPSQQTESSYKSRLLDLFSRATGLLSGPVLRSTRIRLTTSETVQDTKRRRDNNY